MRLTRTFAVLTLVGAAALAAGCASKGVPSVTEFEDNPQRAVLAAGHWDVVAREAVEQTLTAVRGAGIAADVPMYVGIPPNPTEFDRGFREMVVTKMLQHGAPVYMQPDQVVKVAQDTQSCTAPMPCRSTDALEVTYQTQVVKHENVKPLAELIVTTTISNRGRFIARKTDVYYMDSLDTPIYRAPGFRPVNMQVVG